jgi:LysM repeat protein
MSPRSNTPARVLAFVALGAALLAIIFVVSTSLSDEDGRKGGNRVQREGKGNRGEKNRDGGEQKQRAVYIVQSGDTLSGIAEETGVSVAELQALNPDIDPQILVSGQKIKLR